MFIVLTASAAYAQTAPAPYAGVPHQLPGKIEAEDFDNGGQGVAYVDDSPGNSGGAYRATDVDIEATSGGGYNLGWVSAGEWLAYTVNVATTGVYTAEFRLASLGPGGTFHLEMNGIDVTGAVRVQDTGGWQMWQTVTKTVSLSAGVQVARLVMDTTGTYAVGNFDWMRFTLAPSTPFTGTPILLPGTIEAENFDNGGPGVAYVDGSPGNSGGAYRVTDVDIEAASGGGFDVGWVMAGEWLKYTVNVAAAGSYMVTFRVASLGPGGTFHLEMNGSDVTGAISVPDTGNWQTWQAVTKTVTLSAGVQVARLVMDTTGTYAVGNFDSMTFTSAVPTPYTGTPIGLPGRVEAENFDNGGPGIAYVDDSPGNSGGAYRNTDVDLEPTTDTSGGYDVGWVSAGEWLSYTVNVAMAGVYTVQVRVASPGAGGSFHLEANGVDLTGPMAIPDTGGWQTWATVERTGTPLTAGIQTWRLVMDTPGVSGAVANFNWFHVLASEQTHLKIISPAPGSSLLATSVTFTWEGDASEFRLTIGRTAGAADIYASGPLGPTTKAHTVSGLPLNGQTLYVEVHGRTGDLIDTARVQYTAAVRKGLAIITDFANRRLEDWTGAGVKSVEDLSVQLRKMEQHWDWLSRGSETMRWDIIRVQLPEPEVADAYPNWGAFRDAVITLAREQVRTEDYDVNGDGVIDAAWLVVSLGNDQLPFVIGGTSRNAGANLFVDGQASDSINAGATGNFNHELGHCLGLPDMYGTYSTMSTLTDMAFSWPVPPPDFSRLLK
jgi:hypothetical protein